MDDDWLIVSVASLDWRFFFLHRGGKQPGLFVLFAPNKVGVEVHAGRDVPNQINSGSGTTTLR